MATVRISNELKDAVVHQVKDMHQPKIDAIRGSLNYQQFADRLYDVLVGEHKDTLAELPPGAVAYRNAISTQTINEHNIIADFRLSEAFPFPNDWAKFSKYVKETNYYRDKLNISGDHPLFTEIVQYTKDYEAKKTAASQDMQDAMDAARAFLNSHTTLAPALRAWPALWELLPESAKIKHKQKVSRSTPSVKEAIGEDASAKLDDIAAKLAAKRITRED